MDDEDGSVVAIAAAAAAAVALPTPEVSPEKETAESVPLMDQLEERLEETLGIEHLEFGSGE